MNKEETLALYKKGREAWNTWAEEMLVRQDRPMKRLLGNGFHNTTTHSWVTAARSDFSGQNFEDEVDFSNFVFPGEVDFTDVKFAKPALFKEAEFNDDAEFLNATFSGYAVFARAKFSNANFAEAVFKGDTSFENAKFTSNAVFEAATFSGYTVFENAKFDGLGEFLDATFSGDAAFKKAKFSGDARFVNATFGGRADFEEAMFSGTVGFDEVRFSNAAKFGKTTFRSYAGFWKAKFSDTVGFDEATFRGNAGFNQAIFESFADFSGAIFQKEASFIAIRGQSFFTLEDAVFSLVPDFRQAHFEEAPQLDNTHFHHGKPRLLRDQDPANVKKVVTARWRALKRLATQGHDHEREIDFLAEEVKSRRGVQDWLLPNPLSLQKGEPICWPGGGRYGAGLFYQWFSDFGRSLLRPFLWWMAITLGFTLHYLSHHLENPKGDSTLYQWILGTEIHPAFAQLTCLEENSGEPLIEALYLSISNALVISISGLSRSEKLAQSYACLYGKNVLPNAVIFAGIAQTILSAILIFLFLLALRNYFRIK